MDIDDLLRKYEKHLEEGTLSECVAESLAEKVWMLHPFMHMTAR